MFVWSSGRTHERIADGVWLVRGGFPAKIMNVYLLEEAGGVTVFDAGIEAMAGTVREAAEGLGGIRRVVLAHADADHRGSAPGLGAPVYCHPQERAAAESAETFRDYWDLWKLRGPASALMPKLLRHWDGGAVPIAGTVEEGDDIAGFRVVHLPGHAPGLIGLFRESDRLALCSDCIYTLDVQTGLPGRPRFPHPAYNLDTDRARASIRKLAALDAAEVWPGHTHPVRGDVRAQLEGAAAR
ncbi:MAG TPA: MBL fold metallo-hydrolase [Solirubrobacteraceae bacterium]|nr:MBL fold metallo-hydrolase [Solirubrobacteraceae bacterium]